jgi:hypothetical protein
VHAWSARRYNIHRPQKKQKNTTHLREAVGQRRVRVLERVELGAHAGRDEEAGADAAALRVGRDDGRDDAVAWSRRGSV